jgi:hypothetical protein
MKNFSLCLQTIQEVINVKENDSQDFLGFVVDTNFHTVSTRYGESYLLEIMLVDHSEIVNSLRYEGINFGLIAVGISFFILR